jgi:hypothetical protein
MALSKLIISFEGNLKCYTNKRTFGFILNAGHIDNAANCPLHHSELSTQWTLLSRKKQVSGNNVYENLDAESLLNLRSYSGIFNLYLFLHVYLLSF